MTTTSLRQEALDAWAGVHTDAARTALVGLIGDPAGTVTALTVEHQDIGPTFALTCFTDGDLHLGVQVYTDGREPLIGFVELGGDGKWTFVRKILDLPQMGQVVDTVDPVDENAGA